MLYWIIRCVLGLIILLVVFFLIKKYSIIKNNLLYAISFIIVSILIGLMYFVPVENIFITFSSAEKAFNYISSWKIQHIVQGSETDLIVAAKGSSDTYKILPKTEKGWKLSTGLETEKYSVFHNGTSIDIYRNKKTDDYYIRVFNIYDERIEVSDSYGSEFYAVSKTNDESSKQVYYAYIQNPFNDYELFINDEKVDLHNQGTVL